jgi:predicted amidophosphoribosyltransferase
MAAFCACCGAEIKLKPQACPVCGTPRHGMSPPPGLPRTLYAEADPQETSKCLESD